MKYATKEIEKLNQKIKAAIAAAKPAVIAEYTISDNSTQAEIRMTSRWEIRLAVDTISPPKDMGHTTASRELWYNYRLIEGNIRRDTLLCHGTNHITEPGNARTKAGRERREQSSVAFERTQGLLFLSQLRTAMSVRSIKSATSKVRSLQGEQQALLPVMRCLNSRVAISRRSASAERRATDAAALTAGEFWLASKDAIRDHFNPPFDKNYLADVSERWRAALYLECTSVSYKTSFGWRHKLAGTGRAYLCGIDDNGDEWGHRMTLDLGHDAYYEQRLEASVEDAMSELFGVSLSALENCHRQGDLLFRPCSIPRVEKTVCAECGARWDGRQKCCSWAWGHGPIGTRTIAPPVLEAEAEWSVRESHRITSPSLQHNGKYFSANDPITVEHTSHQPVILPAGEYCLHMLQIADAD